VRMNPLRAVAMIAGIVTLVHAGGVRAAEIQVTSSVGVQGVLDTLVPGFEQSTGNKLVIDFGLANVLKAKLADGAPFDVAILTGPAIDALITAGKIVPATRTDLAHSGVGVGIRKGAAKPDIGTEDAFKRTMLAAKSVCYSEKGVSGIYAASVMEKLGIAQQMKPKTTLATGSVADLVAKGACELGIQQVSEIVPVAALELVGPLPSALQSFTTFTMGIGTGAKDPAAATALVKFLTSPPAITVIKANGMDPG